MNNEVNTLPLSRLRSVRLKRWLQSFLSVASFGLLVVGGSKPVFAESNDAGRQDGIGLFFQAEVLYFEYLRSDGLRAGSFNNVPVSVTDDVTFDKQVSPRLTLGYVSPTGLGARVRWFEYEETGSAVFPTTGAEISVDTYTVDLEVFERFRVTDAWEIELSGGVRYNKFEERMNDPIPAAERVNRFKGWGGVAGIEGVRSLGKFGAAYVRGRYALMSGDKFVMNDTDGGGTANLLDTTLGITELALGWEYRHDRGGDVLLSVRAGYEWQKWHDYSSSFTPFTTAPDNEPAQFAGASDVGFEGPTFMVSFDF